MAGDVVKNINIRVRWTGLQQFKDGFKLAQKGAVTLSTATNSTTTSFAKAGISLGLFRKGLRETQREMFGGMLSTLFFGQAIQKVFQTLITSSIEQYMKVNGQALNSTSENVLGMTSEWNILKFTMGEIFAGDKGIITTIRKLIKGGQDFTDANPETVGAIAELGVTAGLALGTFAATGLGLNGLVWVFSNPVTGLIALVAGLAVVIFLNKDKIASGLKNMFGDALPVMGEFIDKAKDIFSLFKGAGEDEDEAPEGFNKITEMSEYMKKQKGGFIVQTVERVIDAIEFTGLSSILEMLAKAGEIQEWLWQSQLVEKGIRDD